MGTLSTEGLADYLKVSKWMAEALMRSKDFPSFQVGRFWRVKEEDLEQWIKEKKRKC